MNLPVRIVHASLRSMLDHARRTPNDECCGLLAGRDGVIAFTFPSSNVSPCPATSYEIAPSEIFHRIREMRSASLELLGIYHSHPNGKNEPSPTDVARAYYPDAAYFILSPLPGAERPVRAFFIRGGRVEELEIQVVSDWGEK